MRNGTVWKTVASGLGAVVLTLAGAGYQQVIVRLDRIESQVDTTRLAVTRLQEQQLRWADQRESLRTELDAAHRQIDALWDRQERLRYWVCGEYDCRPPAVRPGGERE